MKRERVIFPWSGRVIHLMRGHIRAWTVCGRELRGNYWRAGRAKAPLCRQCFRQQGGQS